MKKTTPLLLFVAALLCLALAGCAAPPAASPAETPVVEEPVEEPAEQPADAAAETPAEPAPTPVYADQIQPGVYQIQVSSNSSMFRIVDARLTVADGAMTAVLTLGGDGYEKLYMGTGEEALADTDDHCIYFVEDEAGNYTYTVPVAALDQETDCAAFSIRKQSWYDRVLVFQSDLIPAEAIAGR